MRNILILSTLLTLFIFGTDHAAAQIQECKMPPCETSTKCEKDSKCEKGDKSDCCGKEGSDCCSKGQSDCCGENKSDCCKGCTDCPCCKKCAAENTGNTLCPIGDSLAGINLTPKQKEQIEKICKDGNLCKKDLKKIKSILTPGQYIIFLENRI